MGETGTGDMRVKAYLSQAKQTDRRIEALLERRRRCGELANCRTPGRAPALDALQRELDERIEAYAALVGDIERRIDGVKNPQYRDLLRYRYLNGWSWQKIAGRMSYSRDWLMRLHVRALDAVDWDGQD